MSFRLNSSATPLFLAWMFFVLIQACDSDRPVDRRAVIEEMNARELKRIPETEILQMAQKLGDSMTIKAQSELQEALLGALKEGGVPKALEFCNSNALPILQKMSEEMDLEVYRVTDRPRNSNNRVDSLESLILEAYQYNVENQIAIEPSVMKESEQVLMYTKPITISGGLCLNCHGRVGTEIAENNYDTVLSYYPDDHAIDYQMGHLRGMWVVKIPIRKIVSMI